MKLTIHFIGLCGVVCDQRSTARNFYIVPLADAEHEARLSIPAAVIEDALPKWPQWCPIAPSVSPTGDDLANILLSRVQVQIVDGSGTELTGGVQCKDNLNKNRDETPNSTNAGDLHWMVDMRELHQSELNQHSVSPILETVQGKITPPMAATVALKTGSIECKPYRQTIYNVTNADSSGVDPSDVKRQVFVDCVRFELAHSKNFGLRLSHFQGEQTIKFEKFEKDVELSIWNLAQPKIGRDPGPHFRVYHTLFADQGLIQKDIKPIPQAIHSGRPINCVPLALFRLS